MKRGKHLLLKRRIEKALNNRQLTVVHTEDWYQKIHVQKKAKKMLSEAIRICLRNGITPNCAVDGVGHISTEIITINLYEIWDLIESLEEIKNPQ